MTTPSTLAQLRAHVKESDPSLVPLLERIITYVESTASGTDESPFGLALTSMLETGLNAQGALALLIYPMEEGKILALGISDPFILKMVRGIRAVVSLNTSKANIQSENFMKLLLLLAEEMQALLAVMGIRIWQLRHFGQLDSDRQKRLIADLEHLYLPLAHRLGLYRIKSEMEDFVMLQKYPDIYRSIARELADTESERQKYIEAFIDPVKALLGSRGIEADIKFRIKSISSIWRKMQAQKVSVKEVYDVFAIRIIDKGPEETGKVRCWEIYSLVTDLYKPDPERLRDWISVPRPSGYESLHTTVMGPRQQWVEIQIRTAGMDQLAELGPAAHWRYKEAKRQGPDTWLVKARLLLEPQSQVNSAAGHDSGSPLITNEIFTITPDGDLVRLKTGATVLDFAFDVHTDVGLRCKGARVNGRIMPIRHKLNNGDRVEILTSAQPNVAEDWLKIVISGKAKNRIRKVLQERTEKEFLNGKELLERKLRQWKAGTLDEHLGTLLQHFKIKDVLILYRMLALEKITTSQVKEAIEGGNTAKKTEPAETAKPEKAETAGFSARDEVLLINDEMETTDYHLARCCNPVYGDDIFGFVTVGKGIRIHRNSCPNAPEMKSRYPYRIIQSRWMGKSETSGINVEVAVTGKDRLGIINAITDVISNDMKVMTRSASFDSDQGRFKGILRLHVKDTAHIGWILRKISMVEGVEKATRLKSESY